jgi:hypothetical protein
MTPPRLTNAQVAALAGDNGRDAVGHEYALALEVQQARGQRCSKCQFWARFVPRHRDGYCDKHPEWTTLTNSSWSCADFTPKETP